MIADVGLLGFPNAGKSTFLSSVTDARPKIANYQFTTLEPNLGVVKSKDTSFVIADIPGIIEGASNGVGLGIRFLRHIERTRLLLHLIDVSGTEERQPIEAFKIINKELKNYSKKIAQKKQIIVATKCDVENEELSKELEEFARQQKMKFFKISSVTGEGLKKLLDYVSQELKKLPKEELHINEEKKLYTLENNEEDNFTITKSNNIFVVKGKKIEKIMRRINISDNESLYYLHKNLVNLGIEEALKQKGIKEGNIVKISNYEFEWFE